MKRNRGWHLSGLVGGWKWLLSVAQLTGSFAILAWVPGNVTKTVLLLILWWVTFRPVRRNEVALFVGGSILFAAMDAGALATGVFAFKRPDVLGMPAYEPFLWGFYLLHTSRTLGGQPAEKPRWTTWMMTVGFAACFQGTTDPTIRLAASGAVLLLALAVFRSKHDLTYVVYMMLLGTAVEWVGVRCGEWFYPSLGPQVIPLWYLTMWGGVGLFLRRVLLPLAGLDGSRFLGASRLCLTTPHD